MQRFYDGMVFAAAAIAAACYLTLPVVLLMPHPPAVGTIGIILGPIGGVLLIASLMLWACGVSELTMPCKESTYNRAFAPALGIMIVAAAPPKGDR